MTKKPTLKRDIEKAKPQGRIGYQRIAAVIEDWIRDGTYPAGSQIPKEIDLSVTFGVARETVRRAIGMLVQRGILEPRPGQGTFVLATAILPPVTASLNAWGRTFIEGAGNIEQHFIGAGLVPAKAEEATLFGVSPGTLLSEYLYLALLKGEPLGFAVSHVPPQFAGHLPKPVTGKYYPVLSELKKAGLVFARVRQSIGTQLCDIALATRLDVAVGTPVLRITQTHYLSSQQILQRNIGFYRTDKFEYDIDFIGSAPKK